MATVQSILQSLQNYLEAGDYSDWQKKTGPSAKSGLTSAGASDEAAMIDSYLKLLPDDVADGTYGATADALENNVRAVVSNLDNMINPPPPPL